ncbi:MAG: protoporphyrinogen/coproporphyrinogen oxidase [Actinomycetota bacterium]
MKIIVVGAGPAGLAATYTLCKRGEEVLCLEGSEVAGGRARGFRKDGYVFDLGAQFSADLCTTTFRLCRELGMGGDITDFDFIGAMWRDGKLYPVPASGKPKDIWRHRGDLLRFRGLPWRAYPQLMKIGFRLARRYRDFDFESMDPEPVMDLSDESIEDFALRYGGREALDYLFQPMTASLTLGEPDQVGAAHILGLLMGLMPGLKFLKKGIGSLPEALYNDCREYVRLSTPVKKILVDAGKVKGVETEDGFMDADAVICTTTATRALDLLPGLPDTLRKPLEKVTYSSTVHFIFALRNRLLPEGWYAVTFSHKEGSIQPGFADAGGKSPYFAPPGGGLVHCLTWGRKAEELNRLPVDQLKRMIIKDLKNIIPGMPGEPFHTEVARWDEAICLDPPGQARAIHNMRANNYRDVEGLYLAGSYMYLISCVEGALRSGVHAAEEALR